MKARLPKALLSAIMCAFAYAAIDTAQAGYVTPTTIWTEAGEMQLGNNPDGIPGYTLDVKDGDTEATISKNTETTSGLFVRDGKLTIGGTEEQITLTINPNGGGQLDDFGLDATGTVLNVAGKDAVAVIDNATVTTIKETVTSIGGPDGNGTLIIQNGGIYDGSKQLHLMIGYKSYRLEGENPNVTKGEYNGMPINQQLLLATTNNVNDIREDKDGNADFSNRYEGSYTPGIGGTEFGRGVVTVTGEGSLLKSGRLGFQMAEGELNILDNATFHIIYVTPRHKDESCVTVIGYGNGCTSVVNVKDGAVWNIDNQFQTGQGDNSKTIINVENATVNLNNLKGAFLGMGSDPDRDWEYVENGSTTEFNLQDGATLNVSEELYVGYVSSAKITVAKTASIKDFGNVHDGTTGYPDSYLGTPHDRLIINTNGTVINHGTMDISTLLAGGTLTNTGTMVCDLLQMDGGTLSHSGSLTVNNTLTLNSGVLEIVLTEANQSKEAITLADGASVTIGKQAATFSTRSASNDMIIRLVGAQNVKAGAKFVIFNQEVDLSNATIEGVDIDLTVENGETIITLEEDLYVGRDPQADVLGAAAWGVQKSSQAFTDTLWGGRTNAVVVNNCITTSTDNKGNVVNFTEPAGQTIAWGTAYGSFDRLSSNGSLTGADFNLYGGAMGVEHQFVSGSSIGGAIGYDWGKVSPFNAAKVNQESIHAAVYGRAGQWKLDQNAAVALDLSAAVGSTESKLPVGSIDQNNLQLDARVSYIRSITDKLTASIFAGVQYYAQEDASKANVAVSSMQNLRTMMGAGITYAATAKTTLFAEASVYNDAMRHNPVAEVDGFYEQVANPGRLGGSITAGAAYQLDENWTLRGSYSFEGAKHSTDHNVNAGAVYHF